MAAETVLPLDLPSLVMHLYLFHLKLRRERKSILSDLAMGSKLLTFGDRVERRGRFSLNIASFSAVKLRGQG